MDEDVEAELGFCWGASESEVDKGSASAWASRLSRSERLMKSSSVRRVPAGTWGRRRTVGVASLNKLKGWMDNGEVQ
jgi:hypothetical protein